MKLTKNFKSENRVTSDQLRIGEMMILSETHAGDVLLKIYDGFVNLNDPMHVWSKSASLIGVKLSPGESVTLTQE